MTIKSVSDNIKTAVIGGGHWGKNLVRNFHALGVLKEEPLKNECQAFIEAIKTRNRPLTDGQEGLRVLRILKLPRIHLILGGQWQLIDEGRHCGD